MATARPYADSFLRSYSGEHLLYEIRMFFWLAEVLGRDRSLVAPTQEDAFCLNNVLVEAFAVHLRTLIDFLDPLMEPRSTDVVAQDFCSDQWAAILPQLPGRLIAARIKANKEVAHLTTARLDDGAPEKRWNPALVDEVRHLLRQFVAAAVRSRLDERIANLVTK